MNFNEKCCRVEFDLFCEFDGEPPRYRIYVGNELFTERTFKWPVNTYLTEILQIDAPPGQYKWRLESQSESAKFEIRNIRAVQGPIKLIDESTFKVGEL